MLVSVVCIFIPCSRQDGPTQVGAEPAAAETSKDDEPPAAQGTPVGATPKPEAPELLTSDLNSFEEAALDLLEKAGSERKNSDLWTG